MNWQALFETPRLLMEAELKPVQGTRFQPTGFPDLGPATYTTPDGRQMLLLESSQSMANRLEAVCWDETTKDLVEPLKGLPYVKVLEDGKPITNSILESHRLNSPYILESEDKTFFNTLKEELGVLERGAVDLSILAAVLLKYDPNALIHGIFFSKSDLAGGRLRLPRALSAFIEAEDVTPAASGGVKFDRVDPKGDTKHGFGNVPFHREEYVAGAIKVYFNLDCAQLVKYRLGDAATKLLIAISIFKIQKFLSSGLRLRTACDLTQASALEVTMPENFGLPGLDDVSNVLPQLIEAVASEGLFAEPRVTVVNYSKNSK